MEDIRKISIGIDYKSAMHYIVGSPVLNGSQVIDTIKRNTSNTSIEVYVKNQKNEITKWKEFNNSVPIHIEFNIIY